MKTVRKIRQITIFFITLVLFIPLLTFSQLSFGETEVLFSPRGQIKETIIKAINDSELSIDIAVFIFTSGDIAEALLMAKDRGVSIKIITDKKQEKTQHPIQNFLLDEGFDVQYLKGNVGGFMHHNFAIFDNRLVITGSYNWTAYAEKFNYENVILTDKTDVVKRFQKEFENLSEKSLKETSKNIITFDSDTITVKNETQQLKLNTKQQAIKSSIKLPEDLLNISFKEFDDLFGAESKMKNAQKKQLWKDKFKNRYIKWKGTVCYKGVSLYDWNKVGISHKNSKEADVLIKVDWTKKEKVRRLKVGQAITYTGKLKSLRGYTSPYRVIDSDIIE
ncbi:MAG: phospholipase D-like domain-containing protein [Candidatus Anammoxibacter sp.]